MSILRTKDSVSCRETQGLELAYIELVLLSETETGRNKSRVFKMNQANDTSNKVLLAVSANQNNYMGVFSRATVLGFSFLLAACATPPGEIDSWPVTNAQKNGFSGEVVDVLCELNGNCPDNCGEGTRQLAIKTESAGTVLVAKNLNNYSGASDELWPFCGEVIEINGLFTEHQGVRFFQVQNVREPGGDWLKATRFAQAWAERSEKPVSLAGNWQDHDERVQEIIDRDGRLGLGPEADQEYFK